MGGGPAEITGHLLFTLSWPEPKDVVSRIRKAYPKLKVTYMQIGGPRSRLPAEVPDDTWKDVTILSTLGTLPKDPALMPNIGTHSSPSITLEPVFLPLPTPLKNRPTPLPKPPPLTTNPRRTPEFIHFNSAGLDWLSSHPLYTDTDVPLTNSSGIHGPTISEWVIMTALVSSHKYNLLHAWQRHERWGKRDVPSPSSPDVKSTQENGKSAQETKDGAEPLRQVRDFVGQRLGVLGYGAIGRQTARVGAAMGMDVVAYTAGPKETKESKRDKGYIVPGTGDLEGDIPGRWFSGTDKASLHEFLGQDLDVLLISVPLTEKTRGMLGREEFEILGKKGGRHTFVVNISRGKIVVQEELIAALEAFESTGGERGLRGAALDVADPEPLPDGHPLFSAPNAIVTPHVSGLSVAYGERAARVLEVNVRNWAEGRELINVVDRGRGY